MGKTAVFRAKANINSSELFNGRVSHFDKNSRNLAVLIEKVTTALCGAEAAVKADAAVVGLA